MKKILTVSIMAVMAVTAANAEIASRAYVDQQDTSAVNEAKSYTDTKIGTYTGAAEGATTVAQAIALAVSGGTQGVVTRSGEGAVGSATVPVYVNESGVVTPTTLGSMATENAAEYSKTGADTTYAKQTDFTTLQSAVNNAETGLVATKAIADANKTAIGDVNSGLTKGVADNAAAIAALGNTYATDAELTAGLATKQNTIDAEHKLSSSLVDGLGTMAAEQAADYTKTADLDTTFATDADVTSKLATKQDTITAQAPLSHELVSGLGTMATEAATDYTKTANLDSSTTATAGQVVTSISMADGALSQTTADPLSVTNYANVAGATANGQYVLTKYVDGSNTTFKWELISRTGNESL